MVLNKRTLKKIAALFCAAAVVCTGGQSVSAVFGNSFFDTGDISVTVTVSKEHTPISPYIYGINAESDLTGLSVNAVKQTDPRISSYNWETNLSNSTDGAGSVSDDALVRSYPRGRRGEPALYTERLVSKAEKYGISSRYVTLQMMGRAAAGEQLWDSVFFRKNDSLLSQPDISDGSVYMDEYVSFLVNKYGYAADGGINGYFLDNEPENWSSLYPDALPEAITADELITRSAELASAVKEIDPTALVYGPSVNGIEAFINLNNPGDWEQHAQEYSWFIDYYLAGMSRASEKAGARLLDVLDIQYHTEATNGLLEPIINSDDNFSNNARLQAPRILWDSTYTENSTAAIMHNQHIPLLPTLEASINMYFPGTRLSFSEYNFGGGGHISGGIAVADTLGIFASYGVHMACLKPNSEDISYQKSGINIYTNYDGEGSGFGDTLVLSDNGGDNMSSVYAAINGGDEAALKLVMINKNSEAPKTAAVFIDSDTEYESAAVYSFTDGSPEIVPAEEEIAVTDNGFDFEMEPLTVYMLVFKSAEEVISEASDETSGTSETDLTTESSAPSTETTVTSVSVPEHVSAETYSSVGTTAVPLPEETLPPADETEISADPVTTVTESDSASAEGISGSFVTEASANAAIPEEAAEKKTVPRAVKTVVIILVCAVILGMAYVLIEDKLLGRRSKK